MADVIPCAVWSDSLLVGHAVIDKEHMGIFELAASINILDIASEPRSTVKEIIRQLVDYATTHLGHEEELMHSSEYPYTTGHSIEHWKFLRQLTTLVSDYESGSDEALPNCLSFITNWLVNHIQINDVQLAEFLKNKDG